MPPIQTLPSASLICFGVWFLKVGNNVVKPDNYQLLSKTQAFSLNLTKQM
jgi:hypothetical protein